MNNTNMPNEEFQSNCQKTVSSYPGSRLDQAAKNFMLESTRPKYSYNFEWLSRPIIQYPQDIVAMQEIIWRVKPDLIIETGIAHGGSLIMSASMLAILDYCEAIEKGRSLDPKDSRRKVLGIDIDIRSHNRVAIEKHPLSHYINMTQGSSIAPDIVSQVHEMAQGYQRVLVCLDSNHTHEHVLAELEAYAPLTSKESYCCVFDTIIEDLPCDMYSNRPWGPGNNPKTAIWEYLKRIEKDGRKAVDGSYLKFKIDTSIQNKLLVTVAPDGYLLRLS